MIRVKLTKSKQNKKRKKKKNINCEHMGRFQIGYYHANVHVSKWLEMHVTLDIFCHVSWFYLSATFRGYSKGNQDSLTHALFILMKNFLSHQHGQAASRSLPIGCTNASPMDARISSLALYTVVSGQLGYSSTSICMVQLNEIQKYTIIGRSHDLSEAMF